MAQTLRPLLLAPILLLAMACSQAQESPPGSDTDASATTQSARGGNETAHPAPIEALEAQGLEVIGTFDAPSGLTGYAGLAGTDAVSVYLTADGRHAVVGTLIDGEGEDLSAKPMQDLVLGPMSKRSWTSLEGATWVPDGKPDAPRTVYAFTDANCPYCHEFWQAARPWVESGKVQLRHVMVAVIRPDSANKAAAILGAKSPERALADNERGQGDGGIKPLASVLPQVRRQLDANQLLMLELGFHGTPGIVFLDERGNLQRRAGLPRSGDLQTILGPR